MAVGTDSYYTTDCDDCEYYFRKIYYPLITLTLSLDVTQHSLSWQKQKQK